MIGLLQLAWSFLPGLLWLFYVYRHDRHEPEPVWLVLKVYVAGMLCAVVASLINGAGGLVFPTQGAGPWNAALGAMLVVGPAEEACKLAAVWLIAFRHHELDEPMDGLIYSGAAALGFASLENVIYLQQHGWNVIHLRALSAVPGHFLFSASFGYALGMARAPGVTRRPSLLWAWLVAALLHGLYDAFLFGSTELLQPMSAVGALLVLVVSALRYRGLVRALAQHSPFRPEAGGTRCAACKRPLLAGATFCDGCGAALVPVAAGDEPASCPQCSRPTSAGAAFCDGCGVSLA